MALHQLFRISEDSSPCPFGVQIPQLSNVWGCSLLICWFTISQPLWRAGNGSNGCAVFETSHRYLRNVLLAWHFDVREFDCVRADYYDDH